MNDLQKRQVLFLAQDALKSLSKVRPISGNYLQGEISGNLTTYNDLGEHIGRVRKCQVCALGALLLSKLRLFGYKSASPEYIALDHKSDPSGQIRTVLDFDYQDVFDQLNDFLNRRPLTGRRCFPSPIRVFLIGENHEE